MDTILNNPANLAVITKLSKIALSAHRRAGELEEMAMEVAEEQRILLATEPGKRLSRTDARSLAFVREKAQNDAGTALNYAKTCDNTVRAVRQALAAAEGVTFQTVADAHS